MAQRDSLGKAAAGAEQVLPPQTLLRALSNHEDGITAVWESGPARVLTYPRQQPHSGGG
jgi:hypothetical protein